MNDDLHDDLNGIDMPDMNMNGMNMGMNPRLSMSNSIHMNMNMPNMSMNVPLNNNNNNTMNMPMNMNMNMNPHSHPHSHSHLSSMGLNLDLDMDMDDLSDDDILATSIGGMSSGSLDAQNQHGHGAQDQAHGKGGHFQGPRSGALDGIRAVFEGGPGNNGNNGANTGGHNGNGEGTVNTSDLTGGRFEMTGHGAVPHQAPQSSTQAQAQHQRQSQQQPPQSSSNPNPSSGPAPPGNPAPPGLSEEKARALEALLVKFWTRQMDLAERGSEGGSSSTHTNGGSSGGGVRETGGNGAGKEEFKNFALPLARIKKVMKSDPEVKMISAEVPVLLGKCCEIFIAELTSRAWLVAQSNKRRTLQKSDVAAAIGYSDMFDFLIDIVPREEAKGVGMDNTTGAGGSGGNSNNNSGTNANTNPASGGIGNGNGSTVTAVAGAGVKRKNPGDGEDEHTGKRQREDEDESN